jgi:hypothetical protein
MNCPACRNYLEQIVVEDITLDVCEGGCGGIWFDNYELKKFDEPHEPAGEALNIKRDDNLPVDHSPQRPCPKCDGVIMMRHFFSVKYDVEVDECGQCGGIWLDYGELEKIRGLFETEADRIQAAGDHFEELFAEVFADSETESADIQEKAGRFAGLFSFFAP